MVDPEEEVLQMDSLQVIKQDEIQIAVKDEEEEVEVKRHQISQYR